MIRGIHHFALNTGNLDATVEFYRRAFGFDVVGEEFRWKDSDFVDGIVGVKNSAARTIMMKAQNLYIELFEYSSPADGRQEPQRPHDRGYTHFCVDSDDIESDYERLIAAGMSFPRTVPDEMGGIRSIYGKDPAGNIIEVQQLRPDHPSSLNKLAP